MLKDCINFPPLGKKTVDVLCLFIIRFQMTIRRMLKIYIFHKKKLLNDLKSYRVPIILLVFNLYYTNFKSGYLFL